MLITIIHAQGNMNSTLVGLSSFVCTNSFILFLLWVTVNIITKT